MDLDNSYSGDTDFPFGANDRVPNDEDLAGYNPFDGGPGAKWAGSNDKTSQSSGTAGFCQQIPEWKSFPLEVLPGVCGEFVQESAAAIDVDTAMVALPMLAACAAAIGNSRVILPKRLYTEPAILWLATIAPSGSRKSPALDAPLRPIRKKEGESIKAHNQAMGEFESMKAEYQADLRKWLAGKREDEQPQEPEKPICRRFTVDNSTTEALASRLLDNPRGLLLANDELSGFFSRMNQYRAGGKGGDEAAFLNMFGARSWISDRKTGDKPTVYIPKASLSIAGTVQPGILKKLLTEEHFESGMAARFLMAYPPARVNHWSEDEVSEEVESGYANMVDKLLSLNMPLDAITREPEPICVPLTPAAKKLFVPFHNQHATEQVSLDGDLAAAWSKIIGYSLRLALVIEHIRWASGNDWQHPQSIGEESMQAGIHLAKWFSHETLRIYTILHLSIFENEDRLLAEKIASTYGPVTVRDLMRHLPRQFLEAHSADAALIRLVKAGYGDWEPVKPSGAKGGRPADRKYIPRQSVDKTSPIVGTAQFCHSDDQDFPFGANEGAA